MGKKFITINDVEREISLSESFVKYGRQDLQLEEKRLENLNILQNYLHEGGFCPLTKKQLLHDEKLLDYYILPLKLQLYKNYREGIYLKEYLHKKPLIKVDCFSLENILRDFVDFVCDCKGQKIGVGFHHICKYLNSREFE